MAKWILPALLLAGAALGRTPATVAVLAGFEAAPARTAVEAMQEELDELFAPAGVSLEWYPLEGLSHLGQPDAVVAVRFTGSCEWKWTTSARPVSGALAWTARVDGELQPFITLDCPRIAALAGVPSYALLGQALGRVLAHELYHYLTQQTAHTHTVLFRADFRPRDLLEPGLKFDPSEVAALRQALSGAGARPVKLTAS